MDKRILESAISYSGSSQREIAARSGITYKSLNKSINQGKNFATPWARGTKSALSFRTGKHSQAAIKTLLFLLIKAPI